VYSFGAADTPLDEGSSKTVVWKPFSMWVDRRALRYHWAVSGLTVVVREASQCVIALMLAGNAMYPYRRQWVSYEEQAES